MNAPGHHQGEGDEDLEVLLLNMAVMISIVLFDFSLWVSNAFIECVHYPWLIRLRRLRWGRHLRCVIKIKNHGFIHTVLLQNKLCTLLYFWVFQLQTCCCASRPMEMRCMWNRGYAAPYACLWVIIELFIPCMSYRLLTELLCQGGQLYGDESDSEWMDIGRDEWSPGSWLRMEEAVLGRMYCDVLCDGRSLGRLSLHFNMPHLSAITRATF